jgi:hypothetical protein
MRAPERKAASTSPVLTPTFAGLVEAREQLGADGGGVARGVCGGASHSIGILSMAVLAWYQLSAMTATPPPKIRPRINFGSGMGNWIALMIPGSRRISRKS